MFHRVLQISSSDMRICNPNYTFLPGVYINFFVGGINRESYKEFWLLNFSIRPYNQNLPLVCTLEAEIIPKTQFSEYTQGSASCCPFCVLVIKKQISTLVCVISFGRERPYLVHFSLQRRHLLALIRISETACLSIRISTYSDI